VLAKRLLDILVSGLGLLISSPLLFITGFLVWAYDRQNPFYIPYRVGKDGQPFKMLKFRTMVVNADKTGVSSTSANDIRITPVGHFIRRYKLDELVQLWNVLKGDMSLVGPRPNVKQETSDYTAEERHLLDVRPGITDFSSIVFSDEGEVLRGSADPDLDYRQRIRPWKSRLGLIYIRHASVFLDVVLIVLTVIALISKRTALNGVCFILRGLKADSLVIRMAERKEELLRYPPPGANEIVGN
jgi:lipopolysaccharide/colanic/teichoic acid biosynthesis glycosyltransferase